MSLRSSERSRARRAGVSTPWSATWDWLARPAHHRTVRDVRIAAETGDAAGLAALLDPDVAVVVDFGTAEHPTIRVVRGIRDAVTLLTQSMAAKPGFAITERSVNGPAGLLVSQDGEAVALVAIDIGGGLVTMVWIRLQPEMLRHWNSV